LSDQYFGGGVGGLVGEHSKRMLCQGG